MVAAKIREIGSIDQRAPITRAEWCPKMDLVAICNVLKEIHIYRLNWERLLPTAPLISVPNEVSALSWSSDGRYLAIGDSGGYVHVVHVDSAVAGNTTIVPNIPLADQQGFALFASVESSGSTSTSGLQVCRTSRISRHAITCIRWCPYEYYDHHQADGYDYEDRVGFLHYTIRHVREKATELLPKSCILFCGDEQGFVHCSLFGAVFAFLSLQIFQPCGEHDQIIDALLHEKSGVLVVVRQAQPQFAMLSISTTLACFREIQRSAWDAIIISVLLEETSEAVKKIETSMEDCRESFASVVQTLSSVMKDHSAGDSIWSCFLGVLSGAKLSPWLEQAFSNSINEFEVKRLYRRVIGGLEDTIKLMTGIVQPLSQLLLARCSEFLALSRLDDRFGAIGMLEDDWLQITDAVRKVVAFGDAALMELVERKRDLCGLLDWLKYQAILQSAEELREQARDQRVAEAAAIRKSLDLISIMQFLQDMVSSAAQTSLTTTSFLSASNNDADISRFMMPSFGIGTPFARIQELFRLCFSSPKTLLSNMNAVKVHQFQPMIPSRDACAKDLGNLGKISLAKFLKEDFVSGIEALVVFEDARRSVFGLYVLRWTYHQDLEISSPGFYDWEYSRSLLDSTKSQGSLEGLCHYNDERFLTLCLYLQTSKPSEAPSVSGSCLQLWFGDRTVAFDLDRGDLPSCTLEKEYLGPITRSDAVLGLYSGPLRGVATVSLGAKRLVTFDLEEEVDEENEGDGKELENAREENQQIASDDDQEDNDNREARSEAVVL